MASNRSAEPTATCSNGSDWNDQPAPPAGRQYPPCGHTRPHGQRGKPFCRASAARTTATPVPPRAATATGEASPLIPASLGIPPAGRETTRPPYPAEHAVDRRPQDRPCRCQSSCCGAQPQTAVAASSATTTPATPMTSAPAGAMASWSATPRASPASARTRCLCHRRPCRRRRLGIDGEHARPHGRHTTPTSAAATAPSNTIDRTLRQGLMRRRCEAGCASAAVGNHHADFGRPIIGGGMGESLFHMISWAATASGARPVTKVPATSRHPPTGGDGSGIGQCAHLTFNQDSSSREQCKRCRLADRKAVQARDCGSALRGRRRFVIPASSVRRVFMRLRHRAGLTRVTVTG